MKKVLVVVFLSFGFLFCAKNSFAQVNGNNVGPVLPNPQAGGNVVDKNGFRGPVTVINDLRGSVHNSVPSKGNNPVVLRLLMDNSATTEDMIRYADQLNANGAFEFPNGAIVIPGNELNNLSAEWRDTNASLIQAGARYGTLFNAFSQEIADHGKFRIAPAPPDMYNGDFDPVEWLKGFTANVSCGSIDTLAAHVYSATPAKNVGGASGDTYKFYQNYISQKCGGKTVSIFSEWGADPRSSVSEQVTFINQTQLPGVPATVLIADNCNGGYGGNGSKPFLYYLPKSPYVFKADGTPLDPTSCSGATGLLQTNSFTPKDVPCDAKNTTYSNDSPPDEYQSLRPYPTSPCNKKVEETALMCGNDLIVKKTYHESPNGNCSAPDASGAFTCKYQKIQEKDVVSIDLANASLPILGNTELVPNSTDIRAQTTRDYLTYAQRMNNYVSWYLNGAIDHPDEAFLKMPGQVDTLINYSGPLKKLLPWAGQISEGISTVSKIYSTRHDQAAGCDANGVPVPCSEPTAQALKEFSGGKSLGTEILDEVRLSNMSGALPPVESVFKTFSEYWKTYLQWRGEVCSPTVLGYYLCGSGLGPNWLALFFKNVPYSSTEDRLGQVMTDVNGSDGNLANTIQLKEGQGNGGTVANVSFTPTTETSNTHNLYFAHTQEDSELAKLLQSTYATKANPNDPNSWEGQLGNAITKQSEAPLFNTYGCERVEVRTNPGDNLYGDLARNDTNAVTGKQDQKISGTLKYDASFTCTFSPQVDQACVARGEKNCTRYNTCDKDIYTSLAIYTKTPKVYEISQRLVDGTMGVFKRFFPKVGPNAPVDQIKDIPGISKVSYQSDAETSAGITGRLGSDAQLFFPHVGSLEEYFLQGIQKALRPKDVTGATVGAISGQPLQCTGGATVVSHQILNSPAAFITEKTIALALNVAKVTCTPTEILIGMMAKESRGLANGNTPYSGDPNEIGNRNCAGQNNNCGAYEFADIDIRAAYKYRADQMNKCLTAIGLQPGEADQKKLGVSLCAAATEFWSGSVCTAKQLCDGNEHPLSSMTSGQIENAALEFHAKDCDPSASGKNADSDGAWKYYDAFIKAYAPDVARIRASCQK